MSIIDKVTKVIKKEIEGGFAEFVEVTPYAERAAEEAIKIMSSELLSDRPDQSFPMTKEDWEKFLNECREDLNIVELPPEDLPLGMTATRMELKE